MSNIVGADFHHKDMELNYLENSVANLTTVYPEAEQTDETEKPMSRILVLSTFPIILLVGTIANVLTFIIMQRGSLKHSSTCFYMAVLALSDTCKCMLCFSKQGIPAPKFYSCEISVN